jgi:predicted RNA binding protein YcfA (HicA-like mRNA interferase family)
MLPVIRGKELVVFLETLGFTIIRQRGSHIRMKSDDGRYTSVPVHSGEDIPKGLLRKIIREDLEMELEDFLRAYEKYKGHVSR